MSKKFTLKKDNAQSLIELRQKDEQIYICLQCSGDVKQTAPNPYVWFCEKCNAEYMGPLFEK